MKAKPRPKVKAKGKAGAGFGGTFVMTCRDEAGNVKWKDVSHNIVVNVGLQHILDILFASSTPSDTWYIGLTQGSCTPANADTMGSHSGWDEFLNFSETSRREYEDARTAQSVDNTDNQATFTITNTGGTVGGAFICDDNTLDGGTGTLLCVSAAGQDRTVQLNDTINVEYTFTASDDA